MGKKTQATNHDISCRIAWNVPDLPEWEARFARIRRSNLLQSYDYARAVCALQHQKARWGIIYINGEEAGLVQIREAGLCRNLIHAIMLDRGPLWFDDFGTDEHIHAFFTVFDAEFPARPGRRRRIIPERQNFSHPAYKRHDSPGYQTIWLDLTCSVTDLRAGLRQKWRNMLNKGEKQGLQVIFDEKNRFLPWLLKVYKEDRVKKNYKGPSVRLMRALGRTFGENRRIITGRALYREKSVAAVCILCHGRSATYQIGWTNEKGRALAAQNFLLWQTVLELKNKGIEDFDLGGINDESAKNVKKFKEGLGGENVTLAGRYS